MYSFCNLLLLFCRDYFILKSVCLKSKFNFYISAVVHKRPFFLRIQICSAHASSYVTMVDHVVKLQSNRVNFVSSRRFLIADEVIY